MAKNNIELNIGSTFDGEGFNKLNTALKASSGNVRRVSCAVGQMIGSMEGMDGAVGKLSRTAGGLLGGLLSLGVWGAVLAAVSSLFGWFKKIHDETIAAKRALSDYRTEWHDAAKNAEAYARRVAEWKDAARDREKAEKDAAEAARRRQEAEFKAIDKRTQMEKEYDQYLMKTAELKERIAGLTEDQIAVNSAQRQVAFAQKWGGQMEQGEAQLQLDLAKKKAAENFDRLADDILEELDANDREAAATEAAAKAKAEAAAKEREIAAKKEATAKKVAELDERIARVREEAAKLEENAARARGGKTFGEWQRGERELARAQKREDVRQRGVVANAEREIAQLESERRRFGRGFSKSRAGRLAKLREFVADQDPNNNPKLKEAERLEKEKTDLIAKTQRDIADIAKTIKDNT